MDRKPHRWGDGKRTTARCDGPAVSHRRLCIFVVTQVETEEHLSWHFTYHCFLSTYWRGTTRATWEQYFAATVLALPWSCQPNPVHPRVLRRTSETSCHFMYCSLKCGSHSCFPKWQPFPKGEQISGPLLQLLWKPLFQCRHNHSQSTCCASELWDMAKAWLCCSVFVKWLFIFAYTLLWLVLELSHAQVYIVRESYDSYTSVLIRLFYFP